MDATETEHDSSGFALQTRNVHKFYGSGRNAFHVLRGMDMDAPYGTIYGLLGASGCGKTTLLRCVLGRLPIHSGQILILGKPPGARGHNVPGKDVGYMPQETALIYEFTMLELMYYFGILFRMNMKYTKKRTEFLKDFLNLPTIHRRCGVLSGGQKRRVSFALALLHEPPLLILDEPTVGIDPLLRAKIWRHLLEITSTGNTTIILTTHYIEEARQAHMVGLMRAGKLLAQSNPDELIRAFNVLTLEDVFLKLSSEQELEKDAKPKGASTEPSEKTPLIQREDSTADQVKPPSYFSIPHEQFALPKVPRFFNIMALIWKQCLKFIRDPVCSALIHKTIAKKLSRIQLARLFTQFPLVLVMDQARKDCVMWLKSPEKVPNMTLFGPVGTVSEASKHDSMPARCTDKKQQIFPKLQYLDTKCARSVFFIVVFRMLFFIIIGPTLSMSVFALAYGRDLKGLEIYYTNHDQGVVNRTVRGDIFLNGTLNLGDLFVGFIDDDTIDLKRADSDSEGLDEVRDGKAFGFFSVPENFTASYLQGRDETCRKINDGNYTLNTTYRNSSVIQLHMDLTNQQIYYTVNETLNSAFTAALHVFYTKANISFNIDTPLLAIRRYVYGDSDTSFFDTVTTTLFSAFIIALSMTLTATQLITERKEGVIDRTWVAGVTVPEIIISQTVSFFLMAFAQSIPLFFFVTYVFDLPREGNIVLALTIIVIEGVVGVSFGLMISALLDNEATALELSIGVFYPILYVGGLLWPIESLPKFLQTISRIFPVFYPAHGFQAIMIRGWGLTHEPVYMGFIVAFAWILVFLTISGIGLHFKK